MAAGLDARDPHRRSRVLHGSGPGAEAVGDRFVLECGDELRHLGSEVATAVLVVGPEELELTHDVARAEAADGTAAGEVVEGGERLRHDRRVAVGEDVHVREQVQAASYTTPSRPGSRCSRTSTCPSPASARRGSRCDRTPRRRGAHVVGGPARHGRERVRPRCAPTRRRAGSSAPGWGAACRRHAWPAGISIIGGNRV